VPLHLALAVIMLVWAVPAIGLLVASFRPAAETNKGGWWMAIVPPCHFTFSNYSYVLDRGGFWHSFVNSFLITIPATVLVVMVAAYAAYAFAWMDFPLKNVLFVIVVGLLVVQVTLSPALTLFRDMDIGGFLLNGTILAVWLARTGYGLPFAVFLLRNYMAGLPKRSSSPPRSTAPATPPRSSGGRSDERAGDRLAGDLRVPLGLERPAHRPGLPRSSAAEPSALGHPGQPRDHRRRRVAGPDRGSVRLDDHPHRGLPGPAAVLRQRRQRRRRQRLTCFASPQI